MELITLDEYEYEFNLTYLPLVKLYLEIKSYIYSCM